MIFVAVFQLALRLGAGLGVVISCACAGALARNKVAAAASGATSETKREENRFTDNCHTSRPTLTSARSESQLVAAGDGAKVRPTAPRVPSFLTLFAVGPVGIREFRPKNVRKGLLLFGELFEARAVRLPERFMTCLGERALWTELPFDVVR